MFLENQEQYDPPNKDFLIVALDVLSGLAEGLVEHMNPLIAKSSIMSLLYQCIKVLYFSKIFVFYLQLFVSTGPNARG